ncbi:hypothetical protein DFH08DRAFT_1084557 [Mycena albidolilacea]|uniref:Putative ER transporter 6TM N-terminal domain-containing protein n=1 Tax=Mycena albidolilacea TaxID=1033008 RepID=A0AAD6ZM60_9AGAR|nr:hypothetical protein DFH08DRAFT_1084557 [Mycena albidolilacea]
MSSASSELASDRDKHTQANTENDAQDLEKGVVPDGGEAAEEGKPVPAAATDAGVKGEPLGALGLFSCVFPALRNLRVLKTCVRCVLVSAAAIVLLVDKASLATMGQAGFFAAVSILLPPLLALSVLVLASLTLLIGMLLGWAWGAACMAAAISVQDKALLAAAQNRARDGACVISSPSPFLLGLLAS